MSMEDFILREYGTRTVSESLRDANRRALADRVRKAEYEGKKAKGEVPTLKQQLEDLRDRRKDWETAKELGIVPTVKAGQELFSGNALQKANKIGGLMKTLDSAQLDFLQSVVNKRGDERAQNWYQKTRDKIEKRRSKNVSGLMGVGTNLNQPDTSLGFDNLVSAVKSMSDNKGLDIKADPIKGEYFVSYTWRF